MRKIILVICSVMMLLSACGEVKENGSVEERKPVTIKTSPDKYTWYIKDYVGKNVASFGYTSISGERMDAYGDGYLKLILVNEEGSYIDVNSEDELKEYVVVNQNLEPNTEMKYIFPKDEEGNEEDIIPESQSYEEIVLAVEKVENHEKQERKLTEIYASPDKYTRYIRDYTGRNLTNCGYISMLGDFRDAYGDATVKFVIITDDGSYVDVSDEEMMKKYTVTGQNVEPNTELKLEFSKDENGAEYSNLVDNQNINEIELYVSSLE